MGALSTPSDVIAAVEKALQLAPAKYPPDLPTRADLRGAAEWFQFEHTVWAIGENIRQGFLKHPSLKSHHGVLSAILTVIEQTHLRRGRQSFVLLLGTVKANHLAACLASYLSDPDIAGHVIDALTKMRAGGYSVRVQRHLDSEQTWIRRKAKRYVERFAV